MLLREKPGIALLGKTAKKLKLWQFTSAVILLNSKTILDAHTNIS